MLESPHLDSFFGIFVTSSSKMLLTYSEYYLSLFCDYTFRLGTKSNGATVDQ